MSTHLEVAKKYSMHVNELLDAMLQVDPKKRASIYDLLLMPCVIDVINGLETSEDFSAQYHSSIMQQLDLGWAKDQVVPQFKQVFNKTLSS